MSVLAIFMPMIITKEEAVEIVGAAWADEDSESGKYLGTNLTRVPFIQYSIIF